MKRCLWLAGIVSAVAFGQTTITIRGGLTGDRSSKLEGAVIRLHPIATNSTGLALPVPLMTTTDNGSDFVLTGVPLGEYSVCVDSLKDEILNPCEWTQSASRLTITAASAQTPLRLNVARGATVGIRVDDPDHVVPTPFQRPTETVLSLGVWSADGNFHMARYVSSDSKGHNFELLIPQDTDLRLSIMARKLQVLDNKGVRVDGVSGAVVRADHGRAPVRLGFTARAEL